MINIGGLKLNCFDYILLVDREFTVVYNSRLDDRVNIPFKEKDKNRYVNRNIFEIYPSIKKEASSVVKCITNGEIVVKKSQKFKDFKGRIYCTHNITVPLVREGKIVGAVELAKDMTTIDNVNNKDIEDEFNEMANNLTNDINKTTFEDILTNDDKMIKIIDNAKIMSTMKSPTLIYGETGTGKEVFVQAMINYSGISRKKVVIQNCAAIPQNLIESILFGTSKGAYTGAESRKGLFEEADGGIIFLDELNSIPYEVQGKLLRVLQDGSFRAVGSNMQKSVNVKIIAAMNVDPMEAIEKKQLRNDLFYRLSAGMIYLPPLRERKSDIKLFVKKYIAEYNCLYGKNVRGITKTLEDFFLEYSWYGNVRELKHIIESMISISNNEILDLEMLPAYMYNRVYKIKSSRGDNKIHKKKEESEIDSENYDLKRILRETETETIKKVMKLTNGNKTRAGKILGIPRQTLKYKIDKLKIKM